MPVENWQYNGSDFKLEDHPDIHGFVYLITNLETGKKYIGKKFCWRVIKRPPLKGKKRKRHEKVESDWKDYFGSSEKLQEDVGSLGTGKFSREILHICYSKSECTYWEAYEQYARHAIISEDYYNDWIAGKVRRAHLGKLIEKSS